MNKNYYFGPSGQHLMKTLDNVWYAHYKLLNNTHVIHAMFYT